MWWNEPEFLIKKLEKWPDMSTKLNTTKFTKERAQKPAVISITHSLVNLHSNREECLNVEAVLKVSRYINLCLTDDWSTKGNAFRRNA